MLWANFGCIELGANAGIYLNSAQLHLHLQQQSAVKQQLFILLTCFGQDFTHLVRGVWRMHSPVLSGAFFHRFIQDQFYIVDTFCHKNYHFWYFQYYLLLH